MSGHSIRPAEEVGSTHTPRLSHTQTLMHTTHTHPISPAFLTLTSHCQSIGMRIAFGITILYLMWVYTHSHTHNHTYAYSHTHLSLRLALSVLSKEIGLTAVPLLVVYDVIYTLKLETIFDFIRGKGKGGEWAKFGGRMCTLAGMCVFV